MRVLHVLHIFNGQEQVGSSISFVDFKRWPEVSLRAGSSTDRTSVGDSAGDPFFQ
jgi:hypothetical protein